MGTMMTRNGSRLGVALGVAVMLGEWGGEAVRSRSTTRRARGLTVSGDVSVDTSKDRGGAKGLDAAGAVPAGQRKGGALRLGPGGKAVWPLRETGRNGRPGTVGLRRCGETRETQRLRGRGHVGADAGRRAHGGGGGDLRALSQWRGDLRHIHAQSRAAEALAGGDLPGDQARPRLAQMDIRLRPGQRHAPLVRRPGREELQLEPVETQGLRERGLVWGHHRRQADAVGGRCDRHARPAGTGRPGVAAAAPAAAGGPHRAAAAGPLESHALRPVEERAGQGRRLLPHRRLAPGSQDGPALQGRRNQPLHRTVERPHRGADCSCFATRTCR